jgi:hypothetical protein
MQAIIYFRCKDIELRIKTIDVGHLSRPPLLWLLGADLYLIGTHFFPRILEELEPLRRSQIKAFLIKDGIFV